MVEAMAFAAPALAPTVVRSKPAGKYVLHYGDLRTGRIIGTVPVSGCDFSDGLNGDGSVTATVGPHPRTEELFRATTAGKTMWAVEWTEGHRICAAGVVLPRQVGKDRFTLGGGSIHTAFRRRKVYPAGTVANIPKGSVSFTDLDLGSIMRGIVAHVTPAGTARELPIVLEAARAGSHDRTYPGYELQWAADLISNLADDEPAVGLPGTEFLWEPSLSGDKTVQFAFLTGTQAAPQIVSSTPWRLDKTARGQKLVGEVTAEEDASEMGMRAWSRGGGVEKAAVIRDAVDTELTDGGWPLYEVEQTNNSMDAAVVQGYANRLLGQSRRPLRAVSVEVSASWWWKHGRIGDQVTLVDRHPVMGRLSLTSRVLGVSGRFGSQWVALKLADTIAEEV